jgi:hypothetical protein
MARGKPSINKLLSAMRKLSVEVNDHEVCRKLEILMNSEKDDFSQRCSPSGSPRCASSTG